MNRQLFCFFFVLTSIFIVDCWAGLIKIDGEFDDWKAIREYSDPVGDTFGGPADDTLDILKWKIYNDDKFLYVACEVKLNIGKGKTDRGAYQTILDSDNNYDTGIQSNTETPYPPHDGPLGVDRYISIETSMGAYLGIGMSSFDPDADQIGQSKGLPDAITDAAIFENRYELMADLKSIGVKDPDNAKIRIALLHYSAAGVVDWTMPSFVYTLGDFEEMAVDPTDRLPMTWAKIKSFAKN